MKQFRQLATVGIALSAIGALAGCATDNNTTGSTGTVRTNTTNQALVNTAQGSHTTVSNQATPNTVGTSTKSPNVTLESVQTATNSIVLYTTHGDMQTAYQNPRISNGVFTVTLVNMTLASPLSTNKTYTSNGMSYNFIQSGSNLTLTVQFNTNPPSSVQTGIGGGDIINFVFQTANNSSTSSKPVYVFSQSVLKAMYAALYVRTVGPIIIPQDISANALKYAPYVSTAMLAYVPVSEYQLDKQLIQQIEKWNNRQPMDLLPSLPGYQLNYYSHPTGSPRHFWDTKTWIQWQDPTIKG